MKKQTVAEPKSKTPTKAAPPPALKPDEEGEEEDWDKDFEDGPKLKALAPAATSTPSPKKNDLKAQLEASLGVSNWTEGLDLGEPTDGVPSFGFGVQTLGGLQIGSLNLPDVTEIPEEDWDSAFQDVSIPTKTPEKKPEPPKKETPVTPAKQPEKPKPPPLVKQESKSQLKLKTPEPTEAWPDELDFDDDKPSKLFSALEKPEPKILSQFQDEEENFEEVVAQLNKQLIQLEAESIVCLTEQQPVRFALQGTIGKKVGSGSKGLLDKLEKKKTKAWADNMDEIDELNLDEEEKEKDEKAILREKAQEALLAEIKHLLQLIKPGKDDDEIKKSCLKLMEIFDKNPEMKSCLITNHGLLPLIVMLDSTNAVILNAVLRLVTQIIENNEILVNMCVMGIIPAIMWCGSNKNGTLTRLYAAYFVQRVISSPETLHMFVACRGLSVLSGFLEPDYKNHRDIILVAIDCISTICRVKGGPEDRSVTPRNEYFHLFITVGLLERLSNTLINLLNDKTLKDAPDIDEKEEDLSYVERVASIFKAFSLGDSEIKTKMCSEVILSNLKAALKIMGPKSKESLMLLNMIRNVSFERVVLNNLSVMIVPLLEVGLHFVKKGEFSPEIFNQITHSLFHICRLNKGRQEAAAKAGLIPLLLFVINNNKPLKEFAVPLMCELAGSSAVTRSILLDNNGLIFYFDLLKDVKGTFLTDALEGIAVCVENERERVEEVILTPSNMHIIKEAFLHVQEHELVKLLESMNKILPISVRLNKALGSDPKDSGFVAILKNKLHHPAPHARVNLLKALIQLCTKSSARTAFLKQNNLLKVVKYMATNDSSLLVRNMAQQLLKEGGNN